MSNNLVIKNDSFIQSIHNDIQCIESLDPNNKGTSRQYWFTASMLANIFDITDKTVRNNIEFLMKWGEVQSGKNLLDWKMSYENSNLTRDVTLYDECKVLFGQNILVDETLENTDDFRGNDSLPRNNFIKINSNGMKFINESGLYTVVKFLMTIK